MARMKLSTAAATWVNEIRMAKSKATATCYGSDLQRLIALTKVDSTHAITPELVSQYFMNAFNEGLELSTLHRKASALRQFGKWGMKKGLWGADPFRDVPAIRRPKHLPKPFSPEESVRLWALELPSQEALIRSFLFMTLLRVTPLCTLKAGDISGPRVRALVKGAKIQTLPLHDKLKAQLDTFLTAYPRRPQDPLFQQVNGRPLNRKFVERLTARWGVLAGIDGQCNPHRFRHSGATEALARGVDPRTIQELLGHEDISTTMIYTKVYDNQLAEAVNRLWG